LAELKVTLAPEKLMPPALPPLALLQYT